MQWVDSSLNPGLNKSTVKKSIYETIRYTETVRIFDDIKIAWSTFEGTIISLRLHLKVESLS